MRVFDFPAIFLKAGRSPLHVVAQAGFLVSSLSGLVFGQARCRTSVRTLLPAADHLDFVQLYNGLTPNMYEGSSHGAWGWFTMLLTFALNAVDVARFFLRFTRWGKTGGLPSSSGLQQAVKNAGMDETTPFRLGGDDDDEEDEVDRMVASPSTSSLEQPISPSYSRNNSLALSDAETVVQRDESSWSGEQASPAPARRGPLKWAALALDAAERSLILLAYVEVCSGVAVWTGTCRGNYLNGYVSIPAGPNTRLCPDRDFLAAASPTSSKGRSSCGTAY